MTQARKRPVTLRRGLVKTADDRTLGGTPLGPVASVAARLSQLTANWGPTVGRVLLGLVLAWFGYHELVQPATWTGYVPGVHAASAAAVALVLAHGWVLLILAVALIAGIAPRAAAGLAALLLAEIVIWLWATGGLSDLTLRDVGVLGLAACIAGRTEQHFALTG
jgi:uncharacterized membrane protein YphA (DoxX/SURF4 family)